MTELSPTASSLGRQPSRPRRLLGLLPKPLLRRWRAGRQRLVVAPRLKVATATNALPARGGLHIVGLVAAVGESSVILLAHSLHRYWNTC